MNALRRVCATTIATLVAMAGFAVPASAAVTVQLQCYSPNYNSTSLTLQGDFVGGSFPTTLVGGLSVSWDGGQTWYATGTNLTVAANTQRGYATLSNVFDGRPAWPLLVKWSTTAGSATCQAQHQPIRLSVSGPNVIAHGDRVNYLVEADAPTVPWIGSLVVVAFQSDGYTYKEIGSARLTAWGRVALLSAAPSHTDAVVFVVFDEATDPDHEWPWSGEEVIYTHVTHSTPEIEYNKTVVAGQSVNMKFWMGGESSYVLADIQRYNGLMWVGTGTGGAAVATDAATLSFKPTVTGKYRVYWYDDNKAYAPHTTYFTVTVLPKVALSAPSAAKKGTTVTFTVKHPLATSGSGKLQYLSGKTWKTAKTFSLSSTKTTKVSLKVTATHKWRALIGSTASASATVTAK